MGRQRLTPKTFGAHATEWPDSLFAIRINNERNPERVREAIAAEAKRSNPRAERVALCNRRLEEL